MSDIVVGTMRWGIWDAQFTTVQYEAMIEKAMSLGMSTFDHADIYGDHTTEAEFGAALKLHPAWRSQMELVTKCGIIRVCDQKPGHYIKAYDFTKSHILQSAEDSLRNLQTDYLDVMLLHRPDLLMDPDEVAEAFEMLYTSGKVRSFGVSNFTPSQVQLLQSTVPVGVHQLEVSVKDVSAFDDGRLDQCTLDGIVPMAWSPLGGGKLPEAVVSALSTLAVEFEVTPQAMALAWLLQHPSGILPVVGTTKAENLEAAQAALNIKLDRQQWYTIYQAATGTTLP
ncbi:MAG: aldo/keto reductase [Cryomorphaceae bacterium]|nr:aldo/keto reductase [Cryomorphaceae bacterium]MBL6866931.1 aldo/keto reductase [Cryomorphaceae bacterium]